MTNEQMLTELIELAVRNGWKSKMWLAGIRSQIKGYSETGFYLLFIFNHDFAKAVFGIEEVCMYCGGSKRIQGRHDDYLTGEIEMQNDCLNCGVPFTMFDDKGEWNTVLCNWEYKLQGLAITPEADRIKYCYENRKI